MTAVRSPKLTVSAHQRRDYWALAIVQTIRSSVHDCPNCRYDPSSPIAHRKNTPRVFSAAKRKV